MTTLKLTADREGERADAMLARLVPELTRSGAQKLLERGAVTLEGRPALPRSDAGGDPARPGACQSHSPKHSSGCGL